MDQVARKNTPDRKNSIHKSSEVEAGLLQEYGGGQWPERQNKEAIEGN